MKAHFELYGAKVIWVLSGGASAAAAQSYYVGNGATFGWYTNDMDNTAGANIMAGNHMMSGVPWLGIVDAKNMQVMYNNPMTVYSIVQTLGTTD
jgi:hypothetical protein